MSQVQITGKVITWQQVFQANDFRKWTIIVEVTNGTHTSFFPMEFHNGDIDTLGTQVAAGNSYTFTCWAQGSSKQFTDKNNQPTAYLNLKVSALTPAQQAAAPQPPAQQFAQPQQPQQGFAPQQPQGFAAPAQAPAPQFAPPAQPGIGAPQGGQTFAPPAPQAPQFAPPQPQAAPAAPAFNPNAGQ